jgi:hypothetical protein
LVLGQVQREDAGQGSAGRPGRGRRPGLINLIYLAALLLAIGVATLGIGLLQA